MVHYRGGPAALDPKVYPDEEQFWTRPRRLAVDGFFLEYDDERSGGFAPLRFVPPSKNVVLGLVTTNAASWSRRTRTTRSQQDEKTQ